MVLNFTIGFYKAFKLWDSCKNSHSNSLWSNLFKNLIRYSKTYPLIIIFKDKCLKLWSYYL